MACLALCCCVGATTRSSSVQNNTGDAELSAYAAEALAEQLKARGLALSAFELVTRLEALDDGGLEVQILCSGKVDHLLKGRVKVKGRGASHRKLLRSMMGEAVRDLAADCR